MAQKFFQVEKEIDEAVPLSIDIWRILEKDKNDVLLDGIYKFDIIIYDVTDPEPIDVTLDTVLPGSAKVITSLKWGTETVGVFTLINGQFDRKYDAKFIFTTNFGYKYNEHIYFTIIDPQA